MPYGLAKPKLAFWLVYRKLAALLIEWVASEGTVESTAATVGEVCDCPLACCKLIEDLFNTAGALKLTKCVYR